MTVGEVKELVLSTDGTIPVVVGNLEKMELVHKKQDEKDKRKFILSLTKSGKILIEKIIPENEQALAEINSKLSKEEKKLMVDLIRKYK